MDYQAEINKLKRQVNSLNKNPYSNISINGNLIEQCICGINFQGVGEYNILNNKLTLYMGQGTPTTTLPFTPNISLNLTDSTSGDSDGVLVTINQSQSNTSFEFSSLNPPFIGFPNSMEVRDSNENTILIIDFYSDYQGQTFNFIYLGISNLFTFNNNSIVYI